MTSQIKQKIATYEQQLAKLDVNKPDDSNLAQYINGRIKDFKQLLLQEEANEGKLMPKIHVAVDSVCESCEG